MSPLIPRAIADFTTQLSSAISVGSTSFTLASILDDDGVSIPDGKYCFTIDNGSSDKEYLMGDNVSGIISNVKSVSRQGTETTGAARQHRIGASVILTDFAVIQRVADILRGALTLDGSSPLAYDTAPTLSSGLQLATVAYVLSIVTGGAVTFDKQIISGTAGETLASPNIVYLKEADARWWKADADLTATFSGLKMGVAQSSASAAGAVNIQLNGIATGFSGLTPGEKQYLSNTAGGVSNVAGTNEFFIGWAITSTTILLAFNEKNIPSTSEKAALAGSQSTPSSTNKFITQDNTSVSTTDQTQSTQNSTIETGEADTTTKKNLIAQSFIPAKTKIRGVNLYKAADSGTFIGTIVVTLQADSSGSPSGTPLATRTFTNAEWLLKPVGDIEAIFTSEYASLTPGGLYWIVIDPSTSDNTNHPNFGTNTAGGYSSGSAKYKNTTDGWVAISTIDLYFKTIEGNASQIPVTNSSGKIPEEFLDLTKIIGPMSNTLKKLWYNIQLPFILWVGSSSGAATTDFPMWIRSSTDVVVTGLGAMAAWANAGQDTIYMVSPFYRNGGENMQFNDSNTIVFDWFAYLPTSSTGTIAMGFGNDPNVMFRAYNDTNESSMRFVQTPAGVLYAVTSKAGVGVNTTDLSAVHKAGQWNNYRIELRLGVDAKFYINGSLVATIAANANFTIANENIYFGFGRGDTAELAVTAPNVSMLLNP